MHLELLADIMNGNNIFAISKKVKVKFKIKKQILQTSLK